MKFSDLDGARVGAWGAGRETRSLARALERLPGASLAVVATDEPAEASAHVDFPGARAPYFVSGTEGVSALAGCDVVVRSPGISVHRDDFRRLARQRSVTSGTALWLAERGPGGVVGVTGTKGKSTTATLIAHLAARQGRLVALGGNVGIPALDLLDVPASAVVVVELSSYQIADLPTGPSVAVMTNLFPEHVHWHGSERQYRRDKLRLLGLPGVERVVAPPAVTQAAAAEGTTVRGALLPFDHPDGYRVEGVGILRDGRTVMDWRDSPLPGRHNAANLCAALTTLEALCLEEPELPSSLEGFAALPHRLETVLDDPRLGTWVNDSISTTPESAMAALDAFEGRPATLIAGGFDRKQRFDELARRLVADGVHLVAMPVTGARLAEHVVAAGGSAEQVANLPQAVTAAYRRAAPGRVTLLSPAAASFGAYADFAQRGEHFRVLTSALTKPA